MCPSARTRIRSASRSASSRSCVVSRIGHVVVGQAADQVVEVAPGLGVEAGGRLVEEEQLGAAHQADGDVEPAALAAGQAHDRPAGLVGQADPGEQVVGVPRPGPVRRGVRPVELARGGPAVRAPASGRGRARTAGRRRAAPATPRRRAAGPRRGRCTSPADGARKPSRISIVVVLPAPFGPSRATTSPRCQGRSTPRSTSVCAVAHVQVMNVDRRIGDSVHELDDSRTTIDWPGHATSTRGTSLLDRLLARGNRHGCVTLPGPTGDHRPRVLRGGTGVALAGVPRRSAATIGI